MGKVAGSIHVLSDMQITANTTGLDAYSKTILRNKEVLAVILQEVITEYKGYSWKEAAEFIEVVSMTSTMEVSPSFFVIRSGLPSPDPAGLILLPEYLNLYLPNMCRICCCPDIWWWTMDCRYLFGCCIEIRHTSILLSQNFQIIQIYLMPVLLLLL